MNTKRPRTRRRIRSNKKSDLNEMKIEVEIKLLDIGTFWVPSSLSIVRVCSMERTYDFHIRNIGEAARIEWNETLKPAVLFVVFLFACFHCQWMLPLFVSFHVYVCMNVCVYVKIYRCLFHTHFISRINSWNGFLTSRIYIDWMQ